VLGNTNKVLVDTKGTGSMIYLPLDKLTDRRLQSLTLDEQRQSPAARAATETTAPEEGVETIEARRDRGTR